jgi:uncharacterized protein with FMN-binding domain
MKKFLKILITIIAVLFLLIIGTGIFFNIGLKAGAKMQINNINLSSIGDGSYTGKYSSGRFTNELKVTVKDHKIVKIEVVKDVLVSKPELNEELFTKIIDTQNVKVDTITGATVTCNAYLKAIENALNN